MKKLLLSLVALTAVTAMSAQGLDLQSRVLLQRQAVERGIQQQYGPAKGAKPMQAVVSTDRQTETTTGFVRIKPGFSREDLEAAGFSVLAVRGDVAVVGMPLDSVKTLANNNAVKKMSIARPVKYAMDNARKGTGVDAIHSATEGLDVPYTGKGVLAALIDQGVDPNNVSFLDETGKSRVTYLLDFDGTADRYGSPNYDIYGDQIYVQNPDGSLYWYPTIDKFTTDELGAFHGTHTMNILGGGFKGEIERYVSNGTLKPTYEKVSNPYYGVAPDVQLAVSCGSLNDACIAFGLNELLNYALYAREEHGIPSVVSMSLGSTMGPHDPNSLFNYFLDLCGEETIVVLAAGNEGDLKIALKKDLTDGDTSAATMIYPFAYRYDKTKPAGQYNTYIRQGAVMIYASDNRPFKIKPFIMTGEPGNYRKRATFDCSSQEGDYFLSNDYYAQYVGGATNATIARYFDGYIGGGSMLDEDLNRWYGVFDYYLFTNPETGFNSDGSEAVIVGFEVVGEPGQRIECYADGYNTWMYNYGMDAYMDGMTDGTISDMAVGYNNITVGAYSERTEWYSLDAQRYWYSEEQGFKLGDIGQYSSYGTLADGRTLPHVCAPGSAVISAMSKPYMDAAFKGYEQLIPRELQAKATVDGKTYYWKQETGTSMSTPFVAGTIALWLEADPTLTLDDVRDIIAKTAKRDEFVENGKPAQWGAGKFDALAGLKEVVKRSGVNDIVVDGRNDRLIMTPAGDRSYNIFVGEASSLNVKVYNLTGTTVFSTVIDGCEGLVDLSDLSTGVYIVNVNGHSKKVIIK